MKAKAMNSFFRKEDGWKDGDKVKCLESRLGGITVGETYVLSNVSGPTTYVKTLSGERTGWNGWACEFEKVEEPEVTTQYEVDKWYGWNGGECPVHPETVVSYLGLVSSGSVYYGETVAGKVYWKEGTDIKVFKITDEYKEPREITVDGVLYREVSPQ